MLERVKFPYGMGRLTLGHLPENLLGFLRAKQDLSTPDESALIEQALASLPEYVDPHSKVLILASDVTRKVGTELFLPILIDHLTKSGVRQDQIKVLFSTGLHRPQTQAEQHILLGRYFGQIEAIDHDCDGKIVDYGITSFSTRILLHPLAKWADTIILTGGINFHYFAGFTGGRKALFPGVAARESILHNHRLIFSGTKSGFHPQVKPGQLEGNPVALDMQEAAYMVSKSRRFYLFNTILNQQNGISGIASGDFHKEFLRGCQSFEREHSASIENKAELVIASAGGFPYDTNLIQSHKALYHACQALQERGILILLANCADGVTGKGEDADKKFLRYFDLTLKQMDELFRQKFEPNCNTAYSIAEKGSKSTVILVSQLNPEIVKKIRLRPAESLEAALPMALAMARSKNPSTYIIENAATVLPVSG